MKGITTLLSLLTFLILSSTHAQVETVRGDGRFYTRDDDSITFINEQLRASAYRDVLTKEFKQLGLDSDKFWQKYEEKFQEYFVKVKESLMQKHEVTEETAGGDKDFQKALRRKRLSLKARYGRISRPIKKEKVLKQSRSPQVPNSRYMRLEVAVDRKEIFKIYLQFTNEQTDKHYSSVYITSQFQLVDTSWSEVGIELETDFTEVLRNNWKDQVATALKGKVDQVVFADPALSEELKKFSGLSQAMIQKVSAEQEEEQDLAEAGAVEAAAEVTAQEDNAYPEISNDYGSSLWLRVTFKIKKVKENEDTQRRDFEVSGDLILQDLKTQKYIYFQDYEEIHKSYSYSEPKNMSNGLANTIYQMPLTDFKKLDRSVANAKTQLKRITLDIVEFTNASDIFKLIKYLGEKGVTKQFNPTVKSLGLNSAKIELEYSGDDEEMTQLLRSLSNTMIAENTRLVFPNETGPFELAVKRLEVEKPGDESVTNENQGERS